jgi:APA family basic amino acid/polyamine antiporter
VGTLNANGVPAVALIMQGVWSALLVFSGSYNELLDFVMFAALLFYALTIVGLIRLRFAEPDAPRPYRVWFYPAMPLLYILLCAVVTAVLLFVRPDLTWPGLILVATGFPVYYLWRLFGAPRT